MLGTLEDRQAGAAADPAAGGGELVFGHPELCRATRTAGDQGFEIFVDHDEGR